ncbi:MAG: helix-turn-helix transcriptional regulator [Sandaracinaceae bacterium]|nr:helix-turn-helix transcriptional regulator [Sandaracinaceae bacterium]
MDLLELLSSELASFRYIDLIDQLRVHEEDRGSGWQSAVAYRLGVSQAYVSLLQSGSRRNVGVRALRLACANLGIRPEYFTDDSEPIDAGGYGNEMTFKRLFFEDYLDDDAIAARPPRPESPTGMSRSGIPVSVVDLAHMVLNRAANDEPVLLFIMLMVEALDMEPLFAAAKAVAEAVDKGERDVAQEVGLGLARAVVDREAPWTMARGSLPDDDALLDGKPQAKDRGTAERKARLTRFTSEHPKSTPAERLTLAVDTSGKSGPDVWFEMHRRAPSLAPEATNLAHWMSGRFPFGEPHAKLLAEILGVSPTWLWEGKGEA